METIVIKTIKLCANELTQLHQPIALIHARHSTEEARKIPPEEMSGLQPAICIAKGARVMLTMNLWTDAGLCNGATGTIIHIIYAANECPPALPLAVVVCLTTTKAPPYQHYQTVFQFVQLQLHNTTYVAIMKDNNCH